MIQSRSTGTRIPTINSDVGESIGIHSFGHDQPLMQIVDTVNVACGMHAGDPSSMRMVVNQALDAGVTVGAHPGLPDLSGFGRREMSIDVSEARDLIRYQVGALNGFLDACGAPLDHIKPHGALFSMLAVSESLMEALCDVAVQYGVPIYGLPGTQHERVAVRRDVPFVAELYVDLDYNDDGTVRVKRAHTAQDMQAVEQRARNSLLFGSVTSVSGAEIDARPESFCIHSDLPDALEAASCVRVVIDALFGSSQEKGSCGDEL